MAGFIFHHSWHLNAILMSLKLDLKGYLKLIEMADFQQSNIIMGP